MSVARAQASPRWSALKDKVLSGIPVHPAGLVLAAAYALACGVARQHSLDQFFLPAGIRVAALLMVPPRLWCYLLLGELGYFAHLRIPAIDQYGLEWVILASTLLMPAAMLVVHLHLRRAISEAATGFWLLSLSVTAALAVTGLNLGLSRLLWPDPPPDALLDVAGRVVFGHFAAIITLAPLALLWARRHAGSPVRKGGLMPSVGAIALMLALGLCVLLIPTRADTDRTHLVLLATLPAIALTFLHGWRGAAIAIPLLNLPLHLATPSTGLPASFDLGTFSTQQNMAVMSIALLALGSSISYHHQRARARGLAEETRAWLARSSHRFSERDLRERAAHLRHLGEGMDSSLGEMVSWLQAQGHHGVANSLLHAASVHSRLFREQASLIYPSGLEQVGLYVALQAGGVREAWNSTARVAPPRLAGNPCLLSLDLQLAIYRTLIEAVSLLLELETGQVCIRARCGRSGSRRGIVVVVALLDRGRALAPSTAQQAFERLAARTLAYDGAVQCRGNRLRLVLHEPRARLQAAISPAA